METISLKYKTVAKKSIRVNEGTQSKETINYFFRLKFILLYFCITGFTILGNTKRTAEDIIKNNEKCVEIYCPNPNKESEIVLEMNYGGSIVLSPIDHFLIQNLNINEIALVYTDYPKGADLYQLNLSRIKQIEKIKKDLVSNEYLVWKLIKQTGCDNEEKAKEMFHGIIIKTRENKLNENFLSLKKIIQGIKSESAARKTLKIFNDTTTFNVLNEIQGKNMSIICDFTSSMYVHSGQLLLWFVLNTQQTKFSNVVFFNDGDEMSDELKIPGKVGGLYEGHKIDSKSMIKLAEQTASNGFGGNDLEENDLEAVIYAQNKFPKSNGYVLIADNNASPRDMSLIEQIKKPVHIILCGANKTNPPNLSYLILAHKTNGSIHTMHESLQELIKIKDGEIVNFCGHKFLLKNGNFMQQNNKSNKKQQSYNL